MKGLVIIIVTISLAGKSSFSFGINAIIHVLHAVQFKALNQFVQGLSSVGIEVALLIAGMFGGLVSLSKNKGLSFWDKLLIVFGGGVTAAYVSPVIIAKLGLDQQTAIGFGYALGFYGLKSLELIIDWIKSKFSKE